MKNIIFLLFILIGLNASAQNTTIACYSYIDFTAADCPGCGLSDGLFSGLIVTRPNGARFIISNPFSSKITGNQLLLADAYGKKISIPLSRITLLNNSNNWNLSMYLNKCLCNPAGPGADVSGWAEAAAAQNVDIDGYSLENVDSISFDNVTPILKATNDSLVYNGRALKSVPSGGSTGQVLSKVNGTNYNVQWSTPSTVPTITTTTIASNYTGVNPTGDYAPFTTAVTSGRTYKIRLVGSYHVLTNVAFRMKVNCSYPSGTVSGAANIQYSPSSAIQTNAISAVNSTTLTISSGYNANTVSEAYSFDIDFMYKPASSGNVTFQLVAVNDGTSNPKIVYLAGTSLIVEQY